VSAAFHAGSSGWRGRLSPGGDALSMARDSTSALQHHTGPAAGGRVVDGAMPVGGEVAYLHDNRATTSPALRWRLPASDRPEKRRGTFRGRA
jgi:hypothetical protein